MGADEREALLKAAAPSVFFRELRRMGQLSVWFPETEGLIGVPQNPVFHAEGDVWNHTLLVLDSAVPFRNTAKDFSKKTFIYSDKCVMI